MVDILIRTKRDIEHKMRDNLNDQDTCWWTLGRCPKQRVGKVMFTDGKRVFAEGKVTRQGEKSIFFTPLERVDYPQPKEAPTRGFTYV